MVKHLDPSVFFYLFNSKQRIDIVKGKRYFFKSRSQPMHMGADLYE